MVFNNNLLLGAAGATGGYTIENSVRLDGVADMSRTVASNGNLRTWSWSFWVKRSGLGTNGGLGFNIGGTYTDASNRSIVRFYSGGNGTDDFYWAERSGGAWREDQWTIAQYRDPSAWYHILLVWDTDGGTTPRARRYINGVQITDLGSSPAAAANVDSGTNQAGTFQLFDQAGFPGREFEGYCAEMHFVDGTALLPTDFGEFNTDGVWVAKNVTGITYGGNGFYLDFADSADLGKDVSGNGNNFTSSGLATTDQMLDTPTDNYATLNSVQQNATGLSDGNLQFTTSSTGTHKLISSTIGISSGKWYAEISCNAALGSNARIGIIPDDNVNFTGSDAHVGDDANSFAYVDNGQKESNNTQSAYGASYANGDVIGVALNLDDDEITFYKNGVSQGVISITASTQYRFAASQYNSGGMAFNFGQSAFTYTPPTGFNALSTANLTDTTITTSGSFTGNGSTDGPFVFLNGVPTAMTINGNSVTFATHADKLANGFKVRSSSASYNTVGSNTYSISTTGNAFKNANAQENP